MSRTLTLATRQAVNAAETEEVFLVLLTITVAGSAQPIRVVNDHANLVSRGQTFAGFPFEIELPGETEDSVPTVRLRIDAVDRSVIAAIRAASGDVDASIEVVRAAAPDTVEAGPFRLRLTRCDYDALVIEGELASEDVLNEPFPAGQYIPADYPGLF